MLVRVITPRERLHWTQSDYETALVGAVVQVDTPADALDEASGLSVLTDTGVVVAVAAERGRRWRFRLADGYVVLVDLDSWLRVCRNPGHPHEIGCPALPVGG